MNSDFNETLKQIRQMLNDLDLGWIDEQIQSSIEEGRLSDHAYALVDKRRRVPTTESPPDEVTHPVYDEEIEWSRPERGKSIGRPSQGTPERVRSPEVVEMRPSMGRKPSNNDFSVMEPYSPREQLALYISALYQIASLIEAQTEILNILGFDALVFMTESGASRDVQTDVARSSVARAAELRSLLAEFERQIQS